MKVKEFLDLLPSNQETQLHYKDYGHCSSYPSGFAYMGDRIMDASILKIETEYCSPCNCTIVKIFMDLLMNNVKENEEEYVKIYGCQGCSLEHYGWNNTCDHCDGYHFEKIIS